MKNYQNENGLTITLDSELVDRIVDFKGDNCETYLDFEMESEMKFGMKEKLYKILNHNHYLTETVKKDVEDMFTTEEALIIFLCLADEEIYLDAGKPGRELMLLIYEKRHVLEKYFSTGLPSEIINNISMKVKSLSSSQFMAIKVMSKELRLKSSTNTLRFSNKDIARYFRTAVSTDSTKSGYEFNTEMWYEIEFH